MLLIGDGGSTKADWWFVKNGETRNIKTMGFNPLFHTTNSVIDGLNKSDDLKLIAEEITELYFYGASCSSKERNAVIENGLNVVFKNADNNVSHDLMGAAMATCGDDTGIVCILGTGSNAAYFDGKEFPNRVPALGYVLGDEGRGTYIGKKILADFLYGLVPEEIKVHLTETMNLTKDIVFNHVYQQPHANIYLASFAKELAAYKHLDYTRDLVIQCFKDFIKYHVECYPQAEKSQIHFVGSVAHHFEDLLRESFEGTDLKADKIIAEPGKAILEYFLSKNS
ncbi:MAG: hypothetical protein HKO56_09295 [Bacteroidia bacterium]|nr:hypothetical protein [Bacteroidia bacterium]